MQWTEPAVSFSSFEGRRGAGSAADRSYVMRQQASQPVALLEYGSSLRAMIHWPMTIAVSVLGAILNLLPYFRPMTPVRFAHHWEPQLGWPWVFLWDYGGAAILDWQRLAFNFAVVAAAAFTAGLLSCRITRQCSGPPRRKAAL